MSLIDIQNAALRRTLLVVLIVPVVILAILWEFGKLLLEFAKEIPGDLADTWRGREKRSRHLLRD